jgi:hypothetical protein
MKQILKFYLLFILATMIFASPIFASDITGAKWFSVVTVSNGSTNTKTNVVTTVSLNTTSMINQGFCNSTVTDVAMINTAVDYFMPGYTPDGNPWCLFVPTINPSANANYDIYTKGAISTSTVYFPGTAGASITDNASLEMGNSGNWTIGGFFNSVSTGFLLNKPSAITVQGNGSGNITTNIYGNVYPSISSNSTGGDSGSAQSTIPVTLASGISSGDLVIIQVYGNYNGGTFTFSTPSGYTQLYQSTYDVNYSVLACFYKTAVGGETSANITVNTHPCYNVYQTFRIASGTWTGTPVCATTTIGSSSNPAPPALTTGYGAVKTMFMVFAGGNQVFTSPPTGYSGNLTRASGAPVYSGSGEKYATAASDTPGTFSPSISIWAANTIAVKGGNSGILASSTSPVISSGFHTFGVYVDGVNLGIVVDGSTVATTAFAGSIIDNVSPYTLFTDDIMLYVSSIKMYKSGILKCDTPWMYGATFTDLSGNGNSLTPSFRTTSSDASVTAVISSFQPLSQAVSNVVSTTGNLTVITSPTAPSQMYTEGDFTYLPGGGAVNSLLDASGVPRSMWWFPFLYFGIAILGMMLYGATSGSVTINSNASAHVGSLLTQSIVSEILLVLFGVMGALPLFGAYVFPIGAAAIIMSTKHYGWG